MHSESFSNYAGVSSLDQGKPHQVRRFGKAEDLSASRAVVTTGIVGDRCLIVMFPNAANTASLIDKSISRKIWFLLRKKIKIKNLNARRSQRLHVMNQ